MVSIKCACGKKYEVKDELIGKSVKCKACGEKIPVELSIDLGSDAAQAEPEKSDDEAGDDDAGDEGESGEKRKPITKRKRLGTARKTRPGAGTGSGSRARLSAGGASGARGSVVPAALKSRLLSLAFILGIVGLGCFFEGTKENKIAAVASPEPQKIKCSELEAKGPGSNAHILLTDFLLCDDYAYEGKKDAGGRETWERVWIPAVAKDGAYVQELIAKFASGKLTEKSKIPPPSDVRIVVSARASWANVHGPGDVERLGNTEVLDAVVVNEIERVSASGQRLLSSKYPRINFDRCWIVEVGRPLEGGSSLITVGILALLGAVACGVLRFAPI